MKVRWVFGCITTLCAASLASAQGREPAALRSSTQILVVTTQDWSGVEGTLQPYERAQARKRWKAAGSPIPVVAGKNGLGWDAGAAPAGDAGPRRALDPIKHEGDNRAPAGLFRLGTAFGYAAQPQAGWKMHYLGLTPSMECVDDPASKFYNRVLDRAAVSPDWKSSEKMLLANGQYQWGIVIDYNTEPVTPGAGSCIFMHLWLGPGQGTEGCTAMEREQLEGLLAWLDPARKPVLVQLPRAQYQKLRKRWKLPKLP